MGSGFGPRFAPVAAREAVIVSEPVRNVASSGIPGAAALARLATRVNGRDFPGRFEKAELAALFLYCGASSVQDVSGGRDLLALIEKP